MADLHIMNSTTIPEHEIEITTSRSGGAGGQHVNKTSSRVTLRWNVRASQAFTEEQKTRILEKLHNQLTTEGDLIIHHSSSRSQQQNKKNALMRLVKIVRDALYIPKKRVATKVSKNVKESRMKVKSRRSMLKKMRSKKFEE